MRALSESDLSAIDAQTPEKLAEWWVTLNHFEWPLGLPDEEPLPPRDALRATRRHAIMALIVDRIGKKECLRYHNRENMPGSAFDEWWDARGKYGLNDPPTESR